MKNQNKFPTVVTKPTGKVGGGNQFPKVVTNPGGKVGGGNTPATVKPSPK